MLDGILFSLFVVALAGVCVSTGMQVALQARGLHLMANMAKSQVDLLMVIQLLTDRLSPEVRASVVHQMVEAEHWRDLPPAGRLAMRSALLKVLQDMDREMASS